MTNSSTKSSSPSLLSTISASAETPPRSPDTTRDANSRSPFSPSPLPPLPPEVFLSILRFLPPRDRKRASLVSRSWQSFIFAEPSFWSSISIFLDGDDLEQFQVELLRAIGNGNKKRAGLKRLFIEHDRPFDSRTGRYEPLSSIKDAQLQLDRVLWLAGQASLKTTPDGRRYVADAVTGRFSTLRHLELFFAANHLDTIFLLNNFAHLEPSALLNDLDTLSVRANVPDLCLTHTILFLAPSVRVLSLSFSPMLRHSRPIPVQWFWKIPLNPPRNLAFEHLRELVIDGAIIDDQIVLPRHLPRLERLTLSKVTWRGKGIFRLLRVARHTLTSLVLEHITLEPVANEYADWCEHVDIRDPALTDNHRFAGPRMDDENEEDELEAPCPIHLPNLVNLAMSGMTPPLFADLMDNEIDRELEELPTPPLIMPRLVSAKFDDLDVDPELFDAYNEAALPLPQFGRNAPNLEKFVLTSCSVSDRSVFRCLASMAAKITVLDLYDSTVSDQLLASLPRITPLLKSLDVRGCPNVTCQGVARLVEVMRGLGDRVDHDNQDARGGQNRQKVVEEVFVDKPEPWRTSDRRAFEWLDFIGVLMRGEEDFEGPGPRPERERRVWIREGKRDVMWDHKVQLARKEAELAARALAHAAARNSYGHHAAAAGSSRRFVPTGSHSIAPTFATPAPPPPPPHPHYRTNHLVAQPQRHDPNPFALPKFPVPHQQQQHPAFPSETRTVTAAQAIAAAQSVDMRRSSSSAASSSSSVLRQVAAAHNVQGGGTAPTPPAVQVAQSQESKLDITSLDSIDDVLTELDPALVREQQIALQQIERDRSLQQQQQRYHEAMSRQEFGEHGRVGTTAGHQVFVSQEEAYAAAQRLYEAQRRSTAYEENERRRARQDAAISAVAGQPNNAVPPSSNATAPDPRLVGLANLRTRGFAVDEDEEDELTESERFDGEDDGGQYWDDEGSLFDGDDEDYAANETDALHPNALR
ncbi:hypothetical protein JCM3766R1_004029 [Sporobolomyces carnicolor]